MNPKITLDHLGRGAVVYVRQSTMGQVAENTESQRRQYALAESARTMGFASVVIIDDDLGRGDGAEADPRIGTGAAGVERDVDGAADHRDVHFGARDEAQIGVGLPRLRLRQFEFDDELALLQRGAARSDDDALDRRLAPAVRAGDDGNAAGGDHRRHAVGGR